MGVEQALRIVTSCIDHAEQLQSRYSKVTTGDYLLTLREVHAALNEGDAQPQQFFPRVEEIVSEMESLASGWGTWPDAIVQEWAASLRAALQAEGGECPGCGSVVSTDHQSGGIRKWCTSKSCNWSWYS